MYTSTYFETNRYRDMRLVDETIFHVTADVCTRPVHACTRTPVHETKPRTVYVRARYRNLCTENVAVIQQQPGNELQPIYIQRSTAHMHVCGYGRVDCRKPGAG